ncbi:unnamed protein product [Adineta steineri]|uniref:EF-hand domain-containing protein n=1 Tax=Adineta steineri TaxID=433720 RepID=A0A815WJI1_9BILA|nr:unnamed protein product [Adineta steineri]CAF1549749.1 unnamed protein product [Adineta steineri]
MGGSSSKKPFTEWDLVQFSNMTGVPLSTVETIYKDFRTVTGENNKMEKKEFRHLYKQMYQSSQSGNNVAPFLTDHDLDKMSDHVFETYDFDGSGKLTFEEFAEIYLMLTHYGGTTADGIAHRDRFNYLIDQYDTTPEFITRERAEQIFGRLNKYNNWSNWNKTTPANSSQSSNAPTWEHHWNKLDDGTGRVQKSKFIDYVTTSNEYKRHFDPAVV